MRAAYGQATPPSTGALRPRTHHRLNPTRGCPFAHLHREAEEVYVVLSGSGRVKIDYDVVEITTLDAIRSAPGVTRGWEAGPDGLELLAFGPLVEGVEDFWPQ